MNREIETIGVTGGAGFIGSHLCDRLLKEGYKIVCLDNLRRFDKSKIESLTDNPEFEFLEADIRDRKIVEDFAEKVDLIFHLAAQSDVQGSMEEKDFSFETNVVGTWNIIRAAEKSEVDKVVFSSSREVYREEDEKTNEETPLNPRNYYGASKASAEHYIDQFNSYSDIEIISLRLANVYGSGDKGRVIPIFLEKARKDENLELYGGSQKLDFVWIDDVLDCFLKTIQNDFPYQKMNVASGEAISIEKLAETIIEITDSDSVAKKVESRDYETEKFRADISRMKELGIEPISLEKGLKKMK